MGKAPNMTEETANNDQNDIPVDKAAEYLAGWQRAQADYANLQREVTAQRIEMGKHATAEVVLSFLPVYDYFKRALAHTPPDAEQSPAIKNWFAGTAHIAQMFKMTLAQFGVEEIEVVGKPFDPHTMDAVKEEAREGIAAGTVAEEIEGGYKMGDKILKPAKVVVAGDATPSGGVAGPSPEEDTGRS